MIWVTNGILSGHQTWFAGKWTIESSVMFLAIKPPFSSGIFQLAMFDYQRVNHSEAMDECFLMECTRRSSQQMVVYTYSSNRDSSWTRGGFKIRFVQKWRLYFCPQTRILDRRWRVRSRQFHARPLMQMVLLPKTHWKHLGRLQRPHCDLTGNHGEFREIIPTWPYLSWVKYCHLPKNMPETSASSA